MELNELYNTTFGFEFEGSLKGGVEKAYPIFEEWGEVKSDSSLSFDGFEVASCVWRGWGVFERNYIGFIRQVNEERIKLESAAATHFHCSTKPFVDDVNRLIRLYLIGTLIEPLFFTLKSVHGSTLNLNYLRLPDLKEVRRTYRRYKEPEEIVRMFQSSRQSIINYSAMFEYSIIRHETIEFRPLPSRLSIEANKVYLKIFKNMLELALRDSLRVPRLYNKYISELIKTKPTIETVLLGAKLLGLTIEDLFYIFVKNPNQTLKKLRTSVDSLVIDLIRSILRCM